MEQLIIKFKLKKIFTVALKDGKKMLCSKFVFQQDNATPHTHKNTQSWCNNHFYDFWPKNRWPPNSPDISPLDYCIWNELGKHMNWNKITNKNTLIQEIKRGVQKIRGDVISRSTDNWSKRVY